MPWYIVHETDIDQDAHTATAHTHRAAFDSETRAINYASLSLADEVIVSDMRGNIIYPEEARV